MGKFWEGLGYIGNSKSMFGELFYSGNPSQKLIVVISGRNFCGLDYSGDFEIISMYFIDELMCKVF